MKPNRGHRQPLFEILTVYFNESELRTLCFDLNIDYEDILGVTKTDKAREIILYCERHDLIDQVIAVGKIQRPNASWDNIEIHNSLPLPSDRAAISRETVLLAGVIVSQTMSMVFVDLMRMLFVISSDIAYNANIARYDTFMRVTRQHFDDFKSHFTRFALFIDSSLHQQSVLIERR